MASVSIVNFEHVIASWVSLFARLQSNRILTVQGFVNTIKQSLHLLLTPSSNHYTFFEKEPQWARQ